MGQRVRVTRHRRRQNERRGRIAELLAVALLRLKGFRIEACRIQTVAGEIDLVASRGRLLVIVEVKLRPGHDAGLAAIGARQRRRLQRAAEIYTAQKKPRSAADIRFDVITVAPWSWPRHVQGAWRADD